MSRQSNADLLNIGGEARVDLLPPEIRNDRRAKVTRRRLGLGIVAALVLVVAASGAAAVLSMQAQAHLLEAQSRTMDLLTEQHTYIKVRQVQQQVALAQAGQQVGVSTEINWKQYLDGVREILPASVTIDTVNVVSASPLAIFEQPTTPLLGARVATVEFSATSAVLPDVPAWLTALESLPGFADALPSSVTFEAGTYTVSITMHVNDAAFTHRFVTEEK